jgi:hypothetical protein
MDFKQIKIPILQGTKKTWKSVFGACVQEVSLDTILKNLKWQEIHTKFPLQGNGTQSNPIKIKDTDVDNLSILQYINNKWEITQLPLIPSSLEQLINVNIVNPLEDQVLAFVAGQWVNVNNTSTGYNTVQFNSNPITQRNTLNFIGNGISIVDNNNVTNITISNTLTALDDTLVIFPSTNQVLIYNGTHWANSNAPWAILPALPPNGAFVYWNGSGYSAVQPKKHIVTGNTGTLVTMPESPAPNTDVDVYVNGVLKVSPDDYTHTLNQINFTFSLVVTDRVIIKYFA